MAKIVIDIDDNLYTRLFDNGVTDAADMLKAYIAIRKGTVLPKNATNGDVIKALFPNITISSFNGKTETSLDKHTDFRTDWWDAPYKAGDTNA